MQYKVKDFRHGRPFKAKIEGVDCEGRVSVDSDGDIFLCQNHAEGSYTEDRLGFSYSWIVYADCKGLIKLDDEEITDFQFTDEVEEDRKIEIPLNYPEHRNSVLEQISNDLSNISGKIFDLELLARATNDLDTTEVIEELKRLLDLRDEIGKIKERLV